MKKKMKNIALYVGFVVTLGMLGSCSPNCQMIIMPIGKISKKPAYQEVVFVNGQTQEEIYLETQVWLAKTFVDSKSVISYSDKQEGYIIGKGIMSIYNSESETVISLGSVKYNIEVIMIEGKAKISVDNFYHEGTQNIPSFGEITGKPSSGDNSLNCINNEIDLRCNSLIKDFKNFALRPINKNF